MSYEEIKFFDGKPAVLESSGNLILLNSVKYAFDNGVFYLLASHGNRGVQYDVFYEDIDTSKEDRLEFEYMDEKKVIRRLSSSDGKWILDQEMEMDPDILEKIIEVDSQTEEDTMQTVQALVDPESEEVVGAIFVVTNLGMFFRSENEWDSPTPEMLETLENSNSYLIKTDKAKEFVSMWDDGKKMNLSDLEDYRAEEE
jgi:hypothetical protein